MIRICLHLGKGTEFTSRKKNLINLQLILGTFVKMHTVSLVMIAKCLAVYVIPLDRGFCLGTNGHAIDMVADFFLSLSFSFSISHIRAHILNCD